MKNKININGFIIEKGCQYKTRFFYGDYQIWTIVSCKSNGVFYSNGSHRTDLFEHRMWLEMYVKENRIELIRESNVKKVLSKLNEWYDGWGMWVAVPSNGESTVKDMICSKSKVNLWGIAGTKLDTPGHETREEKIKRLLIKLAAQ